MDICFVEYKIAPERRELYLRCLDRLLHTAATQSIQLYEGSDQPNLFVEIWHDFDLSELTAFKAMRTGQTESAWAEIIGFVSGGADRMHIWHFRNMRGGLDRPS